MNEVTSPGNTSICEVLYKVLQLTDYESLHIQAEYYMPSYTNWLIAMLGSDATVTIYARYNLSYITSLLTAATTKRSRS
jgi:hypothetical protein